MAKPLPPLPDFTSIARSHGASLDAVSLALRQLEFGTAILDPDVPVPPGLVGPDGLPSARRFGVYRNNVVVGLVETLKAAFPAVLRIVGDEFFTAMARVYVAREPPGSPIMVHYGKSFPDFVAAFEPASSLPYLSDVARIERAWAEAYYAGEARSLDPIVFTHIPPDDLPAIRLTLHPSARIVRSSFPAFTIWQMNVGGGAPRSVDLSSGGEDVLIVRPDSDVEVRVMPPGGVDFIEALARGSSVLEAASSAMLSENRFDPASTLSLLISSHALVGFHLGPESKPFTREGSP